MSQSKFVSSIPNNKLEPVFLGGGDGSSTKSSGAYVPAFLRNKNDTEKASVTNTHVTEFKMTDDDFPTMSGTKSSNTTATAPKTFTHYSSALKKDIDKPKPKVSKENSAGGKHSQTNRNERILDDYSDYDSDDHYGDNEPF